MNVQNQTVVITGATSGIGLALAKAYGARGYNVVANARSRDRLEQAAAEVGAGQRFHGVVGDIGDPRTAATIFAQASERFGSVDILINNAGIFSVKPVTDFAPAEIDALISTNLKGFVFATQEAAAHMKARGRGQIINISASIALQPNAAVPASVPILIKGGINQATKALALELAAHNIRVNAVAPGIIDTPMYTADMHGFLNTLQPIGRFGSTDDVVKAVLYVSDSSFTTGTILAVDGGMSAGKW